jgi:putative transcriptional regulator
MGKAFDDIMAGLQDALAYAQGDTSCGKATTVTVPDVDVRVARRRLGMTQPVFARTFGVSVATVRNWEQRRRRPEGAARVLLRVIETNPTAVLQAIQGTATAAKFVDQNR